MSSELAVMVGILGTIYLILYLAFKLDPDEHYLLRFSMLAFAFILLPLLGNAVFKIAVGTAAEQMGLSFFKMMTYANRFFFIYIFLYILYSIMSALGMVTLIAMKLEKVKAKFGASKKW